MRIVRLLLVLSLIMIIGSTFSYHPVSYQLWILPESYAGLAFKGVSNCEIHVQVIGAEVVPLHVFVLNEEDLLTCIKTGSLVNTTPLAGATGTSEISLFIHFPAPGIYGLIIETNVTRQVPAHVSVSSIPPQLVPLVTGLILLLPALLFLFGQRVVKRHHVEEQIRTAAKAD